MQVNSSKSLIKKLLKPVVMPPLTAFQYLRARRIVRDYAANYQQSRDLYLSDGQSDARAIPSLDRLGVRVVIPGAPGNVLNLPDAYQAMVTRIADDVARRFELTANCLFMPRVERGSLPARTADMQAIKDRDVISLQLKDAMAVEGVRELGEAILPEIERKLFASYVIVDKVYVYRNLVTRQQEQVSWLWHYDNHPTEVMKVMIYLTDVGPLNAPFEYVRRKDSGEPMQFVPKPLVGNSRVSAEKVGELLANGHEAFKATGPQGTMLIFDDNVLHRATFAREGRRDALVYQIRPAAFKPAARLDPKWSGSFEHVDFNQKPGDYHVRLKGHRFSG
jgi:hypothetical protein